MEHRGHIVVASALACMVGITGGYFAGREHAKYEIRAAIETAAADFRKVFSAGVTAPAPSPTSITTTTTTQAPAAESAPPVSKQPPISIKLVNKGFKDSNIRAGDFEDVITFAFIIENLTDRDIRAFDGLVTFTDLLDNKVISISLAINDPLGAHKTVNWSGGIKYNQFMDEHQRLRSAIMGNIKVAFTPRKALFADGTTATYN